MTPPRRSCLHQTLVAGDGCRVELCSHGTAHLVLGDLTLRLQVPEFLALAEALAQAAGRLEAPRLHS